MKIISLVENTSSKEYIGAEHGLSLYIETKDHRILFDAGQTELFAENAIKLGVDLSAVDIAVLSHGHYDHGGGMLKFLELNSTASLYLSRLSFGGYYNGTEKYIGLDPSLARSDRLVYTDREYRINGSLCLYSCNGKQRRHDLGSFGLTEKKNGTFIPDSFLHEQYLLIEEDGKRVLISGCSHKGIINIAEWFSPDVLVGGFHFSKLECNDTLREYAEALARHDTDYYTCHCTGLEQYEYMRRFIPRLSYLSGGNMIEV
jgi:7,8-dihydropterin-6-yl-methyl-4-(beta-D-ribofuranosyl)aminobenzene 5'-phosphate synthase